MTTSSKLHPHLKSFIRNVVLTASSVEPNNEHGSWKEKLMLSVLNRVIESLVDIGSQDQYTKVVDENIDKSRVEIERILDFVSMTLKNIPLDLLRVKQGIKTLS